MTSACTSSENRLRPRLRHGDRLRRSSQESTTDPSKPGVVYTKKEGSPVAAFRRRAVRFAFFLFSSVEYSPPYYILYKTRDFHIAARATNVTRDDSKR